MRIALILPLLALSACGKNAPHYENGQLVCDGSDRPIYSNRFTPQAGASGVATPDDALGGKAQSDPNAPIPSAGSSEVTAMAVTCGHVDCGEGQVAVEIAPDPSTSGGGIGGEPATSGPISPDDDSPAMPPATVICTAPPPVCEKGLSPQFTGKQTWECTDCSLVVTYGGQFGNVRRCAAAPTLTCPDGQVPTWVYEDEQWECKPTCDNGEYDQHVIGGQMVCVPC